MSEEHAEVVTLAEFSRIIRRTTAWVAMLKKAGRLALTDDGRVRVAESVQLIESTSAGQTTTAERHERARQAKAGATAAGPDKAAQMRQEQAEVTLRLRRAQAEREEMQREREAGALLSREDVGFAMRDIGAAVRVHLENFPGQVAPLIAERVGVDRAGDIEELLRAECTRTLEKIAAKLTEPHPNDG